MSKRPTKVSEKIPVFVSPLAWGDIMDHTDKVENEIGGVFKLSVHNEALYVDEVVMLPQRAASDELHLSTDPGALDAWLEEQGFGSGSCVYANWGQWHSHAGASVGRSGEDEEAIREYVTHGWYVTLIVNKKRNVHCSVDTLAGANSLTGSVHLTFDGDFALYAPLSEGRAEYLAKERSENYVEYRKNAVSKAMVRSNVYPHDRAYHAHGWDNGEYMSSGATHKLDSTRMACSKCRMVRVLCPCKGTHTPLVSTEWDDVVWPCKGRIPARIRKDGFKVRFHLPGDMTLTTGEGDTVHWLYSERKREATFLRALGVRHDVVKRFSKTGVELRFSAGGTFTFVNVNTGTKVLNAWGE